MSISRRQFLAASAALGAAPVFGRLGYGQAIVTTETTGPASQPAYSAAVRAVIAQVGEKPFAELLARLGTTNSDIHLKGLKTIRGKPNAGGKFLTGYPYTEFYDWDLYFENLYLSYYGISAYCFTNLKEFLARQTADGYINRSLNKQRDRQHFKPFMAQLVISAAGDRIRIATTG